MRLNQLMFLLIVIIIVSIILTFFFYSFYKIYEVRTIAMDVRVEEGKKIGLTTDADTLHFGIIPSDNTGTRTTIITNNRNDDVLVRIKSSGVMSDWLSVSPNNFILEPSETEEVSFTIRIPKDASLGNHTGKVKLFFIRP